MEKKNTAPVFLAILLILIGVWLLLQNFGISLLNLGVWWPVLPGLLGVVLVGRYFANGRANPDDLGGGLFLVGLGIFLLAFYNNNLFDQDWAKAWPVFPLLIGISNGITWLFHWQRWSHLLWTFIGFAVAAVGFAFTGGRIDEETLAQIARLWPVFLILAGLGFLVQGLLSRDSDSR